MRPTAIHLPYPRASGRIFQLPAGLGLSHHVNLSREKKMLRRSQAIAVLSIVFLHGCLAQPRSSRQTRPGTLLLNMLIKNEAEHLDRSLPKWAPLIDYWIVGIGVSTKLMHFEYTQHTET